MRSRLRRHGGFGNVISARCGGAGRAVVSSGYYLLNSLKYYMR